MGTAWGTLELHPPQGRANPRRNEMANTPKKSTTKKATKSNVTKCPPAKAKGIKTTAEVPSPKRKTITKKATAKNPAKKPAPKKAKATLSDRDVVVFKTMPFLVTRQKLVSLIPKNGISVSALIKKGVEADINSRGETTPEYVRKHIEGSFRARKIGLKE